MAVRNDALEDRLSRHREITIRVTGRRSGRTISIPVWFVSDDESLYLLPARGSDTEWYKNVLKSPSIGISAGGAGADFAATPIIDPTQVSSVIEQFRAKYGEAGLKLYSKLDVAVLARPR